MDEKEDSRSDRGGDSDWSLVGNDIGTSGMSFTGDDESWMEDVEGKSEEEEDSGG